MLDGKWESTDSWWGFKEGMLRMSPFNEAIPDDVIEAANMTQAGIVDGSAPVFAGPIVNQAGEEKAAAGHHAGRRGGVVDGLVCGGGAELGHGACAGRRGARR